MQIQTVDNAVRGLSSMRILITGGAGFIGSAVARALVPLAEDVVLLDSLHPDVHGVDPQFLAIPGTRLIHADVTSSRTWHAVLAEFRPTAVIHLAAETGTGLSLSQATRHGHVNVVGTTAMLDALFESSHRPEHIVLASSRAVYGEGRWVWTAIRSTLTRVRATTYSNDDGILAARCRVRLCPCRAEHELPSRVPQIYMLQQSSLRST